MMLFNACSFRKIVKDPDAILNKYSIKGLNKRIGENADDYVKQKPNRKILGFSLLRIYVGIYSLFETPKHRKFYEKIKNNLGEAPVIYDSTLTKLSAKEIESYLFSIGYFNAEVSSAVEIKRQKANVTYSVILNEPYLIKESVLICPDTGLEKLIQNYPSTSLLIDGQAYNEQKQIDERIRLTNIIRNAGYYEFNKEYIYFEVDSNLGNRQVNIETKILNPPGESFHQKYFIGTISLFIQNPQMLDNSYSIADTVNFPYKVFQSAKIVNPKIFQNKLFVKKGDLYQQMNIDISYSRIADLGIFGFINFDLQKNKIDSLIIDCNVYLKTNKSQEIRTAIEGYLNNESNGISGNISVRNKNTFKGAEDLELRSKIGFESQVYLNDDNTNSLNSLFNTQLLNNSLNFSLPKFIFFDRLQSSGKYGNPRSRISLNYNFDNRPDYTRTSFLSSLSFEWKESAFKNHSFSPISINVVDAKLSDRARNSIINSNNRYLLESFLPHISAGGNYSFTYNSQEVNRIKDFQYFKFNIDLAGNSFYFISKVLNSKKDSNGVYNSFGLPFYNFVRPELDFRHYKVFDRNRTLVFRIFSGIGIPYLNSNILPFEKQFFIGGSASIRAFTARSIGPGEFTNINKETGTKILNIDQTGDIKIEGNIEYRFLIFDRIIGSTLRGAVFTDYGNIWELTDKNSAANTVFNFNSFYKQLAVGSGFGFRFDFSFFLFRVDIATKVLDPQFDSDYLVIKNFYDTNWKASNGNYKFVNFNFGIGYPF